MNMSQSTTESKVSASTSAGKLIVTTTVTCPGCTTTTAQEHDKYQYLATLQNEKTRNLSEIQRLTDRNTALSALILEINALMN